MVCQTDWISFPMVQCLRRIRSPAPEKSHRDDSRRDSCHWRQDSHSSGWITSRGKDPRRGELEVTPVTHRRTLLLCGWSRLARQWTTASRPCAAWLCLSTASPWLFVVVPSSPVRSPRRWTWIYARQYLPILPTAAQSPLKFSATACEYYKLSPRLASQHHYPPSHRESLAIVPQWAWISIFPQIKFLSPRNQLTAASPNPVSSSFLFPRLSTLIALWCLPSHQFKLRDHQSPGTRSNAHNLRCSRGQNRIGHHSCN
jgi:hypothetical protein